MFQILQALIIKTFQRGYGMISAPWKNMCGSLLKCVIFHVVSILISFYQVHRFA